MEDEPNLNEVVISLVTRTKTPGKFLELYYWSQEENLTDFIRGVISLRPPVRNALMALFKMSSDPRKICMKLDGEGSLVLTSQDVKAVMGVRQIA